MDNIMEVLDQRNIELGRALYSLKQTIDIDKLIGLNADNLNKQGIGKKFFGHIQMISIESIAINICKIFEKEKKYPLNSIPGILSYIKLNNINPKWPTSIDEFMSKYGTSERGKDSYIEALENICNEFYKKHNISLGRYDYARDKVIAHTEYQAQKNPLPSHAIMEEILVFGADFYSMINKAFIGVGPHQIDSDKQISSSLNRLFEKIGLNNIKTEFEE
jgi:hypothetical protein